MLFHTHKTRRFAASVLAVLLIGSTSPLPAHAFDLGGVLGSLIGGAAVYKSVDEQISYVNNTEEGRQKYFEELKKSEGVSYDPGKNALLDSTMARLSQSIASVDPAVEEKPFLYFLNPNQEFNAACGMGHVMTVNEGIFSLTDSIDEIAVVLAHEMGHGIKDHVASSMKKKIRTIIAGSVAASAIDAGAISDIAMNTMVNQINQVQIGRKDEWEADNLAFDYCYMAGYNPGAGAALWARVEEKMGQNDQNFVGEIFSPSDHPSNSERRENYEKKLKKLSGDNVTIKKDTDIVQIRQKDFLAPAALPGMSAAERKYFLMGNLAAAYAHGDAEQAAYVSGGTVYLGNQAIMTPAAGDPPAEELAALLNRIK